MTKFFTSSLKTWHQANPIDHVWKKDKAAYNIWVSEIILQQTRVAQGTPYYIKFIKAYPTLIDLSNTDEKRLFAVWEGLGYYRRASNMLKGAKYIVDVHSGIFPRTYDELIKVPGIGPYTAAAISSFAFNLPHAVVDGNVNRVISRWFNIDEDLSKQKGKKAIFTEAQKLLEAHKDPAAFNQAIMDFGANQCKPAPDCEPCLFQKKCQAFKLNKVDELPQKKKKAKKKIRYFHSFVFTNTEGEICIEQRTAKDIWQNLYQFPMIEKEHIDAIDIKEIKSHFTLSEFDLKKLPTVISQILSHQLIHFQFYEITIKKDPNTLTNNANFVPIKALKQYGFPKSIVTFLSEKDYIK